MPPMAWRALYSANGLAIYVVAADGLASFLGASDGLACFLGASYGLADFDGAMWDRLALLLTPMALQALLLLLIAL